MELLSVLLLVIFILPLILGAASCFFVFLRNSEKELRYIFIFDIINLVYLLALSAYCFLFLEKLPLNFESSLFQQIPSLFCAYLSQYALPLFFVSLVICCIKWYLLRRNGKNTFFGAESTTIVSEKNRLKWLIMKWFFLIYTIVYILVTFFPLIDISVDTFKAIHNITKSEIIFCGYDDMYGKRAYAITDEGIVDLSPIDIPYAHRNKRHDQQILSNKLVEIDITTARKKLEKAGIELVFEEENDIHYSCMYKDKKLIHKEEVWTNPDSADWSIVALLTIYLELDDTYDDLVGYLLSSELQFFCVEK